MNKILYPILLWLLCSGTMLRKEPQLRNDDRSQTASTVPAGLYGFNVQTVFENKHSVMPGQLLTWYERLKPSLIRFPGGGPSNFYRFDQQTQILRHPAKNWTIDLNAFADHCLRTGASIDLVLNFHTGELEENLALVRFFRQKNVPIAGVELGNELYFKRWQKPINRYIADCKAYTAQHRKEFPQIPVIAVAAQIGNLKGGGRKDLVPAPDHSHWNSVLSKEDFFDGISFHWYFGEDDCMSRNTGEAGKIECLGDGLGAYVQSIVPEVIAHYADLFPGKTLWITEWNIFEPGISGNTLVHAAYTANFMLALAKAHAKGSPVMVAQYHNFTTHSENRSGYNMLSVTAKADAGKQYIPHTSYFAFLLIKDVFTGNCTFDPAPRPGIEPPLVTYSFTGNGKKYVFVTNTSDRSFTLPVKDLQLIKGKDKVRIAALTATRPEAKADSLNNADISYDEQILAEELVNIRKYSITRIEIPL